MNPASRSPRQRLLPAVLTAAGVALLAAGLLDVTGPVQAEPLGASPSPSSVAALPTPPFIAPSFPPLDGSAAPPSATPSSDPGRIATRIVIDQLDIDLPVIAQPNPS